MTRPLTVGVLGGTGTEGRGLALRFAAAGLPVGVGSRQFERAKIAVGELEALLRAVPSRGRLSAGTNSQIAAAAEFVILAVPFEHAVQAAVDCAAVMDPQSILVDATVPLAFRSEKKEVTVQPLAEGSGSRHLAAALPPGLPLAAAFKTLPARLLGNLDEELSCDEFVCADSPEVRRRVAGLLSLLPGLRAIDAGGLDMAESLERLCALAVTLNRLHKSRSARFRAIGL